MELKITDLNGDAINQVLTRLGALLDEYEAAHGNAVCGLEFRTVEQVQGASAGRYVWNGERVVLVEAGHE